MTSRTKNKLSFEVRARATPINVLRLLISASKNANSVRLPSKACFRPLTKRQNTRQGLAQAVTEPVHLTSDLDWHRQPENRTATRMVSDGTHFTSGQVP